MSMIDPAMGGGGTPPGGGPSQQGQMAPMDHLRMAIEHAQAAMQGEQDDQLSAQMSQAIKTLYGIFALLQKEQESAMGMQPQHKAMMRGY